MSTFQVNRTPTGWTVVVDGKLRGSFLHSVKDAEHVGRLHTDPEYKRVYDYIVETPHAAIKDIQTLRRRKTPHHYGRLGREILAHTRGRGRPKEGEGLKSFPLSWESSREFYGDLWRGELIRRLKGAQSYFKELEDEEAKSIVYQMALALRRRNKEEYDSLLDDLTTLYGEYY